MKAKVLNMRVGVIDNKTTIYIGRPSGNKFQHFGNPFSPLYISKASVKVNSRDEAIDNFEKWIRGEAFNDVEPERRKWILKNLHLLKNKHLACWCAPKRCHGDIYLKLLKERKV